MIKHENVICPSCKKMFICKSNRINLCQCMKIELNSKTKDYIEAHYDECLCINCLDMFNNRLG